MKSFIIKKDFEYHSNLSEKENKKQQTRKKNFEKKCADKIMKEVFKYLRKDLSVACVRNNEPYVDLGNLELWTNRCIYVKDDRFWCKAILNDNTSIFEKIIKVVVLSNTESYTHYFKHILNIDSPNKAKFVADNLLAEDKNECVIVE